MILENMDEIYNNKKSSSKIRTTDVTTINTTPITSRPHQSFQNWAQKKLYREAAHIIPNINAVFSNIYE